jgi:GNAT superfamily N-acetyltransferase
MINKIYTLYKRYGIIGIVENFVLKIASVFGYKNLQILRLVCKDVTEKKRRYKYDYNIVTLNFMNFLDCCKNDKKRFSNIYIKQIQERFMQKDSGYKCYGIMDSNVIIAYSWTSLIFVPRYDEKLKNGDAFIFDVYTHPDYRGKGLFPKLLEYQINELNKIGKKRALACIDIFNRASLHAFKKNGFTEISKYYMWIKNGIVHSTLKM